MSVRVPRELRERMRRFDVDWSGEIRRFIEERVRALELLELLGEVERGAQRRRVRVDSAGLVRESRDGG